MKKILRFVVFFFLLSVLSINYPKFTKAALKGGDGKTFQERRQEWRNSAPDPTSFSTTRDSTEKERRLELYLFKWLERCSADSGWRSKCKGDVVTETIQYMATTGYWINPGPKQQRGYMMMIPLKYYGGSPYRGSDKSDVISVAAYNAVVNWHRDKVIRDGKAFDGGQPNKEIASAVGAYLYTAYYDKNVQFDKFGCGDIGNCAGTHWKTFSYPKSKGGSGKTFELNKGPYNAYELMRDWIMMRLDGWFARSASPYGMREWDSNNYHRHQTHQMSLLEKFAPDSIIQRRGKMAMDISILDALMDFSANGWGGTRGRTDYKHMDRSPQFGHRVFFGISGKEDDQSKWDIQAQYAVNREPSDLFVSLSKFTENWRFHKEYNEKLNNSPGYGKWTYLTDNYNIGSSVGQARQGWSVVVRGPGDTSFTRFIINDNATEPPGNQETNYQGKDGRQFRNALYADIGTTPYYWEFGTSWDEKSTESEWQFKRKGNVYVAVRLGGKNASVEVAERGVDYSSYSAFKSAIKSNASLGSSSYTTSKGVTISKNDYCGLNSPGDCSFPFDAMETESSHGKLIDWNNGVMKVSKGGKTCSYNFNNWTYSGDCGATGGPPPPTIPATPTSGVTDTPTPTNQPTEGPTNTPPPISVEGDLDGDSDVDIFDYNILLENFGSTNCGNQADIDGNCKVDIFDYNILLENFGRSASPTLTQPPSGGGQVSARVELDPNRPNQNDYFIFRAFNNSQTAKVEWVELIGPDSETFDIFPNTSSYTVTPDVGVNNDGISVRTVTVTFTGGLAPGSSVVSNDNNDLDWNSKSMSGRVHFSNGTSLPGQAVNVGDSDDENSDLWVIEVSD